MGKMTLILVSAAMAAGLAGPALALDGGNGGDREPAGGAFLTSYPEQGSTGFQKYGTPRSVDIPRSRAVYGEATDTIRRAEARHAPPLLTVVAFGGTVQTIFRRMRAQDERYWPISRSRANASASSDELGA